jgi:starch synthase (maltosyl-transferring)
MKQRENMRLFGADFLLQARLGSPESRRILVGPPDPLGLKSNSSVRRVEGLGGPSDEDQGSGVKQVHKKESRQVNIENGRRRAVIEAVSPEIDGGRFPIKRVVDEAVRVEADIFADGHAALRAVVTYRHRTAQKCDGSIPCAENPPKKSQDIYPLDFETEDWQALWQELKGIFEFWIEQGMRVFRADNPHTKPFRFWEWCLTELKQAHPELIFLSEGFTRSKVMNRLAKLGFTQSYNYFPWRNTRHELVEYLTTLTQSEVREYFRPCLWPNTPDSFPQYLQYGGTAAFMARLVLAATLGASYGVYGPPFLACENQARESGSEDYPNSEKDEIRHWEPVASDSLAGLMTQVNRIRRAHPALQRNDSLRFHPVDNEHLIAYSKSSADDLVLTIVNLDPHQTQRGWVTLPVEEWDLAPTASSQVHDLLTDACFLWSGCENYVELDPHFVPAHILRLRRYLRTEQDFDYFM